MTSFQDDSQGPQGIVALQRSRAPRKRELLWSVLATFGFVVVLFGTVAFISI